MANRLLTNGITKPINSNAINVSSARLKLKKLNNIAIVKLAKTNTTVGEIIRIYRLSNAPISLTRRVSKSPLLYLYK